MPNKNNTLSHQMIGGSTVQVAGASSITIQAQGPDGAISKLNFYNTTEEDAIRQTLIKGLQVIAIEQHKERTEFSRKSAQFPILLFSQELLALMDAGLNLTEALTTLHAKEKTASVKSILYDILQALKEGKNLSDILTQMPKHFPEVYVATIRASERTGDISKSLERYIAYQIQFELIKKKLISASIYPVMLIVVGGLVTLFLLGYVVPKFSVVYESSGRDIPLLSKVLLAFGKTIYQHWQVALLAFGSVMIMLVGMLTKPAGRAYISEKLLQLPWVDEKANEFRLARFYRAVSLLLSSGIALPRAMGMVSGMLSEQQKTQLSAARLSVEQGNSLSNALLANHLASPVADSLIRVGEKSGQLADMLERTARFHDEEFTRWIDWASKLLEPILMTVIGLVIGTVVTLMYIPIFDLAGSIK